MASNEFSRLVRSIGECRSKAEEDKILREESEHLKQAFEEPKRERSRLKELLVRLVYLDMLGHDTSFGHVHAVKATTEGGGDFLPAGESLQLKKVGYLATNLLISEHHELQILMVNTIQKDLHSDNLLVSSAALMAAMRLIGSVDAPTVIPIATQLLSHSSEIVRKKAVMCLSSLAKKAPAAVEGLERSLRSMLCDTQPSVIAAAVCALEEPVHRRPGDFKRLVPSLVNLLRQVTHRKLPKMYEYHGVPAPFLQMRILSMLATLGENDAASSEEMSGVLADVASRADQRRTIGNAILLELVNTVARVEAGEELLRRATTTVSKFLSAENNNLKCAGIQALKSLALCDRELAAQHVGITFQCLDDPDHSLRAAAIDLLAVTADQSTAEMACQKMLEEMDISHLETKASLSHKILSILTLHSPTSEFAVETMISVIRKLCTGNHSLDASSFSSLSPSHSCLLPPEGASNRLIELVQASNESGKRKALQALLSLSDTTNAVPFSLLWPLLHLIGELPQHMPPGTGRRGEEEGKGASNYELTNAMEMVVHLVDTQVNGTNASSVAVHALLKILRKAKLSSGERERRHFDSTAKIDAFLLRQCSSAENDTAQRASELNAMLRETGSMEISMNAMERQQLSGRVAGEIDHTLSFLDEVCNEAKRNNAPTYQHELSRVERYAEEEAERKGEESTSRGEGESEGAARVGVAEAWLVDVEGGAKEEEEGRKTGGESKGKPNEDGAGSLADLLS